MSESADPEAELGLSFDAGKLLAGEPVGMKLDQRKREPRATEQYIFGQRLGGASAIEAHVDELGTLPGCLDELDDAIREEEHNRGVQDSKLRRRIGAVADAADVEVTNADLMGDDKIARVLTHGADDVEKNPGSAAYRAETLLHNLRTWGAIAEDELGNRVTITSPEARDQIE